MNQFNINEAFRKSIENFQSTSRIFNDGLNPSLIINVFEFISPDASHGCKFTELQIHFAAVQNNIMFDFMKSALTLCQGHFSDHYFFIRRSVEYIQLYAFIQSSENSKELFKEFLGTQSTSSFKKRSKRFEKWFKKEKFIFEKKFPSLIGAYSNACEYASHAGLSNQTLAQSWIKTHDGFEGTVNYFDLANSAFEKTPFAPAMIQLFRVYIEILNAIFYYKLTPVDFPEDLFNQLYNEFNSFFLEFKDDLIRNNPEYINKLKEFKI